MVGNLLGLLKLKVLRGIDLAKRDRVANSSDPYVILHLGKHKVRTCAVMKQTNPEWNEQLTLSVEDPNIPLRIEVFDLDLIRDDKMGYAEVDLQPLMGAVKQDSSNMSDGTVITTLIPNRENCFAEESKISWLEGKVVQHMALRLRDVERGVIEIEVTYLEHDSGC